jgi:hypothetical protein
MKPAVFIQTNDKQLLGARVAAHALKRNSKDPEAFDVRIIRAEEHRALHERHGLPYLREGKKAIWNVYDLQSFTPTRFLPPQLCGYRGRALVIDPDVFALADVMDLLRMDMAGKALLARRIVPTNGRRSYWASSVMLLDCAALVHWRWEKAIEEMFSFKRDYRGWVSLDLEPPNSIGALEDCWNQYDRLDTKTKLLHNTGRLTQPWKTGLPIDFTYDHNNGSTGTRVAGVVPRSWFRRAKCALNGRTYVPDGHYQPHPDEKQERLFFSLLKECLDSGEISESELKSEIARKNIRSDACRVLENVSATVIL